MPGKIKSPTLSPAREGWGTFSSLFTRHLKLENLLGVHELQRRVEDFVHQLRCCGFTVNAQKGLCA